MNPKTFLAFALGCFVAGGAAYVISRPAPLPAPATAPIAAAKSASTVAEPEPPAIPVITAPVAARTLTPAPQPATQPARRVTGFVRASASKPVPSVVAGNAVPKKSAIPEEKPPVPGAAEPVVTTASSLPAPQPPAPTIPERSALSNLPPVPPPPPPAPKLNTVTIPAGTMLSVRLQEALSSERNLPGDTFHAVLDQPVIVDGFVIAEKGARVEGRVTELQRSGKVKGLARLVLELTRMNTSDGQRVQMQTSAFEQKAEESKKSDALKVGLGAAIGAAIGGMAGGGKGAATGAGVGGAAGAGQVLLTRGKEAALAVETRLSFRLQDPIALTERLN